MKPAASNVSCTLSQSALRQRQADIRDTLTPHIVAASFTDGVSRLTFARPAVSRATLENLVTLEQVCCPFLSFDIDEMDNVLVLHVSGPEGSQDFIRDLFLPERSAPPCCAQDGALIRCP